MSTATRMKGKRFTPTSRKMTKRERDEQVKGFISLCFAILTEEHDFKGIAEKTGLAYSTICYLFRGRVSRRTQFGTVQAMGLASGLRLVLTEEKSRIELVD